jgi:tetratricopeptide (TPR) repeat protein
MIRLVVRLALVYLVLVAVTRAQTKSASASDVEFSEGQKLYESGDLAGALTKYRHVLASKPDDPDVLFATAQVLGDQGAVTEAEQAYLKAINIYAKKQVKEVTIGSNYRPNIAMALNNVANLFSREKRFDQARKAIDQAFVVWPTPRSTPAELFVTRGVVLEGEGNPTQAIQAYRDGLARSPQNAEGLLHLGILLTKDGKSEEAKPLLEKGVTVNPTDPLMFNALGNAELKSKEWREAAEAFGKAVELAPQDADLHLNLSIALEGLGRTEEAKKESAEAERLRGGKQTSP